MCPTETQRRGCERCYENSRLLLTGGKFLLPYILWNCVSSGCNCSRRFRLRGDEEEEIREINKPSFSYSLIRNLNLILFWMPIFISLKFSRLWLFLFDSSFLDVKLKPLNFIWRYPHKIRQMAFQSCKYRNPWFSI